MDLLLVLPERAVHCGESNHGLGVCWLVPQGLTIRAQRLGVAVLRAQSEPQCVVRVRVLWHQRHLRGERERREEV